MSSDEAIRIESPGPSGREILSQITLEQPLAKVFRAWAEPGEISQWWGPQGFSNRFYEFDLRPGGDWKFDMIGPDGKAYPNHSRFTEVVPSQLLAFDHVSGPVFKVRVQFSEEGGKTKVVWQMLFETPEALKAIAHFAVEGNRQNLVKLKAHLEAAR
jgi:uncharacterized protein YndB with AHSA1/START domain